MSIKYRIFATYLVLISIIVAYIGISSLASSRRQRAEAQLVAVLELRNEWNAMRIGLGDMVINWDDGAAYRAFSASRGRFGEMLTEISAGSERRPSYSDDFRELILGLSRVWSLVDEHLDRVTAAVENPGFRFVEKVAASRPGLQRLNHLWSELSAEDTAESLTGAYLIQQLIGEVEFFPIYGDTAEGLFSVLVSGVESYKNEISRLEEIVRLLFFVAFLSACLLLASRFAHGLSEPIVAVSRRLNEFAGLSGTRGAAVPAPKPPDELALLGSTVDELIAHYTELARRAGLLARGEISDDASLFSGGGVVAHSLDEIADYMKELARTSAWIKDGEYGLQIRERSERDVITHNFNIMSAVIREKIGTLRGMFESVDEAVLVLDERGAVVEANARLREMAGAAGSEDDRNSSAGGSFATQLVAAVETAAASSPVFLNLRNANGQEVPVRVIARELPENGRELRRRMFLITDESWKARIEREQEKLRSQATLAELRALRAQINPHFFFNTLNTIAHLIETDREAAVETVERLADLFRYTLSSTKRDWVPLREELQHVRVFLEIEQLRHGETLRVTYDVPELLVEQPVPPMLLQPLVENAVRYGADQDGTVSVALTALVRHQTMVISVADSGAKEVDLASLLKGSGTGLRNVNQRVVTMYGRRLSFRKNEPSGLVAELRLPLRSR